MSFTRNSKLGNWYGRAGTTVVLLSVLVWSQPGIAFLDLSDYGSLEEITADLDTTFSRVKGIISENPTGQLAPMGLTHLRNLVEARYVDYFHLVFFSGCPLSRKKVEEARTMHKALAVHDQELLSVLGLNRNRFDKRDREEVDNIIRTLRGAPEKFAPDTKGKDPRDHLEEQLRKALRDRDYNHALSIVSAGSATALIEQDGDLLRLRATVYSYHGRFQEAVDSLQMALDRTSEPTDGLHWILSAFTTKPAEVKKCLADMVFRHMDVLDDRETWYRRASGYLDELDDEVLYNRYAWLLAERQRDAPRARALVEKALAHDATNGYYLDTYGYVLLLEGRHDEAASFFERALNSGAFTVGERRIVRGHLKQARDQARIEEHSSK